MSKIKHFEGLEVARVNSQLRKCKAEIKTFYTWKWAPGKGVSYWKASFLVSMVVLRCGVGCWSISNAFEGLTLDLFSHGMKRGEWHGVIITWWQEDFPKSYWVLLTVLLCQPPNSYGILSKSIFLRLTKNPCNFFGWQSFFNQTEKTFFFNHVFGWQKKTRKIPSLATWSQWGFHCWWLPLVMISVIQGWTMVAQRQKGKPISKQKRVTGVEGGVAGTCIFGGLAQQ